MAKFKRSTQKPSTRPPLRQQIFPKPVEEKADATGDEESYAEETDVEEYEVVPYKKPRVSHRNDESGEESELEADEDQDEEPATVIPADDDDVDEEEINIAIAAGLVNVVKPEAAPVAWTLPAGSSKYIVNNVKATKTRVEQLVKRKQPWAATIDETADKKLVFTKGVNEDFEREEVFLKQAVDCAAKAVAKLEAESIRVLIPENFIAQMVKSDVEMQRIKKAIDEKDQQLQDYVDESTDEDKPKKKNAQKKQVAEAGRKSKKGRKGQLRIMVQNAKRLEDFNDDTAAGKGAGAARPKMTRGERNLKYSTGAKMRNGEGGYAEGGNDSHSTRASRKYSHFTENGQDSYDGRATRGFNSTEGGKEFGGRGGARRFNSADNRGNPRGPGKYNSQRSFKKKY